MKLLKVLSISFLFSLSLLLSGHAFAVETPAVDTSESSSAPKVFLLATVNISNYKIVSQKDNVFNISFTLTNRVGIQTGIKYGLQLIKGEGQNATIVDEKVYPDYLTLSDNSYIPKEITYEAPKTLSGDYNLALNVTNESGFPFGNISLGRVTLKGSQGLEITPASCFLQIVGEKNEPHHNIAQSVNITKDETIRLTCSALNSTTKDLSVKPTFETFKGNPYGSIAPQTGGSTEAITFKSKEQKTFSVILPISNNPQFYYVNFKLAEGDTVSNTISAKYSLGGGAVLSISNLSLDKDNYQKGDTAILSLLYNLSSNTLPPNLTVKASIVNNKNQECITPIDQALEQTAGVPITNIPVSIIRNCLNPKVSVSILDDKGTVLDQKDFLVNSTQFLPSTASKSTQTIIFIIIGVLLVLGIALYFINLKKKHAQHDFVKQNETDIK